MTTTNSLTASTITDRQVRALRSNAAEAGDYAQVVICDLALGELDYLREEYDERVDNLRVAVDYYGALTRSEATHLRDQGFALWTREQAYESCARSILDSKARED